LPAIKSRFVAKGVNVRERSKNILFGVFALNRIMKPNYGEAFTI